MEGDALVEIIDYLWDEKHVGIKIIVSDDDSTINTCVKHSIKDKMLHGEIDEWPKTKSNNPKKNTGKLRYVIPEPANVSDPIHKKNSWHSSLQASSTYDF